MRKIDLEKLQRLDEAQSILFLFNRAMENENEENLWFDGKQGFNIKKMSGCTNKVMVEMLLTLKNEVDEGLKHLNFRIDK